VQPEAKTVAELQAEGGHLVLEAEFRCLGPDCATSSVPTPGRIAAIEASIHCLALV